MGDGAMTFSRRHFVAVARILADASKYPEQRQVVQKLTTEFVTLFGTSNPRFSAQRFRDAAAGESDKC
jgi:hypothetical protein